MTIKHKLLIGALIALASALLVGATLLHTVLRVGRILEHIRTTDRVKMAAFDLNALTGEFLNEPSARIIEQWLAGHRDLGEYLVDYEPESEAETRFLERMRNNHRDTGQVFASLRNASDKRSGDYPEIASQLLQRLAREINILLRAMTTEAELLNHSAYRRLMRTQTTAAVMAAVFVIVIPATIGVVAWILVVRVVRPVGRLRHGMGIIGAGNLDHSVGTPERDEIGELSRAFDNMVQRLKATMASRDEMARAVAERKQAERRLTKLLDDLQHSNAELQQFAYVASHDLQEPLRMVSSYVQLLKRRYEGALDERADMYIQFAVDGAARMQGLINDLLAYSRVGTQGEAFRPVDCKKVVRQTVQNLEMTIQESQAEIRWDDLPAVHGDQGQLVQLFQNLIANAVKFRSHDAPRVQIAVTAQGPFHQFAVTDNGIGIEPEYQDRIFVIFQRLHNRDKYPGTGIGLALCKKIVERHGGHIWFESEPGRGTTFFFTLPAANMPYADAQDSVREPHGSEHTIGGAPS